MGMLTFSGINQTNDALLGEGQHAQGPPPSDIMLLYTLEPMKLFTCTRLTIPALALLLLAGCNTTNRLHDYDFDDARVAVVANMPPRPVVFTDLLYEGRIDPDDPIGSIFRVGSAIVKQAEAQQAQERMNSALDHVDVADRVAQEAMRRSAPSARLPTCF